MGCVPPNVLVALLVALPALAVSGCFESKRGAVAGDARGELDAFDGSDAPTRDAATAETGVTDGSAVEVSEVTTQVETDALVPPPDLPIGTWLRETIGDCIAVDERLTFGTPEGHATWVVDDNNACSDPDRYDVLVGRLTAAGDHVLALDFEPQDLVPRQLRWTWAIVPPPASEAAATLTTSAFRRVPDLPVWRRQQQELRGNGQDRSDKRLDVSVTLDGYPDVTKMVVSFDVSWRFGGNGGDPRGGSGVLTYPASRRVDSRGRTVIAADGYDIEAYPDRYHFSQSLLATYDGHTVDLISEAFFPVLYEVSGAPESLYFDYFGTTWTAAAP